MTRKSHQVVFHPQIAAGVLEVNHQQRISDGKIIFDDGLETLPIRP